MINAVEYWIYSFFITAIAFIPGFAATCLFKDLNSVERLSTSFGFSFLFLTALALFFASGMSFTAYLIFICIMIVSILYLYRKRSEIKFEQDIRFLLLVLVIGLVSELFLQTLWEYPVMGGDWFTHAFLRPYRFETGDWMPDRDRTPLFNLLIYAYHKLLQTSLYQYWVSQVISVVINSIYIFPVYLIAKRAFGDWVAKVSALFMLVTPFLIFNTLYTWPKNAAMYGILMMIYFLFFSEQDIKLRYPLAGFFAGLGFWFHNYAVFYIGIAVLLLVYKEKWPHQLALTDIFNNLKRLSYFLVVLLVVLAPYFAWIYSYYGTVSTSKFIYYPFAVKGYYSALLGDEQELFNTFYSTPIKEIIMIRISNAVVTLTPAALPINPVAIRFPTYNPIYYYSHDYPGALSTLMYLVVVVSFLMYLLRKTEIDGTLIGFIVLPIAIYLILYGWRDWGLLTGGLHPTIPLLIIIGFNRLNYKLKYLIYGIFISAVFEGAIYGSIINKSYYLDGGINEVARMGREFIPDFEISKFVSAHFLLSGDMLVGFLISVGLIIAAYIVLYNRQWLERKDYYGLMKFMLYNHGK